MRTVRSWPGLWPGMVLVSVGVGLLARELGYLPPELRLIDFWPLLVVFLGLSSLVRAQGFMGGLFALGFAAVGGLLLADKLGFLRFEAARYWPALIILLGFFVLRGGPRLKPNSSRKLYSGPDHSEWQGTHGGENMPEDVLDRDVNFSGVEIRFESKGFRGGSLRVLGGGAELDFRAAELDPKGAVLDLHVVMGGVDIRVPHHWRVSSEVSALLGGADDTTSPAQRDPEAPRLVLRGSVVLGGVSVRN